MIERVARIGASYLSTHGGCRNGAVCRAAARLRGAARERKLMRTGGRADGRTGGRADGRRVAADGHVAREIPRRHASPAFAARKRITGHRITQHRITQHRITERGHTT
nr:hypothetical protein [Burkholderia pseudomallei]